MTSTTAAQHLLTTRTQTERHHLRSHLIALAAMVILTGALTLSRAAASHGAASPIPDEQRLAAWADDHLKGPAMLTTTHVLSGIAGSDDWFLSQVTATLLVQDGGGGIAFTMYRLDGAAWLTYTAPFVIAKDGVHALEYYSVDLSERLEPTRTAQIRVDTTVPSSWVATLPAYHGAKGFTVSWVGSDNAGSGLAAYDIQYKEGFLGTWLDWLTGTTAMSATFGTARHGHVYYFRSRAHDLAGNVEPYPDGRGDTHTYVDSVVNGGFESGSFDGWTATGEMSRSIASALIIGGAGAWAALLGSPDYGDSITPTADLHVPANSFASISQVVTLPSLYDMPAPALSLWYHIFTYDVVLGCSASNQGQLFDSFDVYLVDPVTGSHLAMPVRDGNFDCASYLAYYYAHGQTPPLVTIAIQRTVNLTPLAGRSVILELRNSNRRDEYYNTWTYVDQVSVINHPTLVFRVSLPVVASAHAMQASRAPAQPAWPEPGPRR